MKRFLLFLLSLFMILSLASCEILEMLDSFDGGGTQSTEEENDGKDDGKDDGKGDGSDEGGENNDEVPGLIFKEGSTVAIIRPASDNSINVNPFLSTIWELTGKTALNLDDSFDYPGHKIVLGDTALGITVKAKAHLQTEIANALADYEANGVEIEKLDGYLVYSDGSSVALVWSDDDVKDDAITYFMKNYLSSSTLVLEEGYISFEPFNKKEMILAQEKADRDAAYAKAEEMYGSEVVKALDEHLAMFGEDFYLWLAALYEKNATDLDGNVLGGAFYYSNSARDNDYYSAGGTKYYLLPDLESTRQVLSFLKLSGMMSSVNFVDALPEEMREQMISFARALQSSEDGYFYHPQWGTDISDSRRSRDCGWGATLLTWLGSRPYWNTPSGTSGIYGAPGSNASSALLLPLGSSTAQSASRVVLAANEWTGAEHLLTVALWETYLEEKTANIGSDSYSVGNDLSSQNAQIKNREKLAIQNGELSDPDGDGIADNGYIRTIERILNNAQKSNGLWETTVSERSVNGLMKISGIYSNLGLKFNKADKALDASISMITTETMPGEIVTIYNAWVSTNSLLKNLAKNGDEQLSASLLAVIQDNAYEMITATTQKVAKFKKADGSFGYRSSDKADGSVYGAVPYKSQGEIAAVRYTVEGDVNGGTIAFTGIWSNMCEVLDIDILPFGYEDLLKFIDAIDYER